MCDYFLGTGMSRMNIILHSKRTVIMVLLSWDVFFSKIDIICEQLQEEWEEIK